METHGCVSSTVATDALALKHQAITIHIDVDEFHTEILLVHMLYMEWYKKIKSYLLKTNIQLFKGKGNVSNEANEYS